LESWIGKQLEYKKLESNAELAKRAEIAPSTISMILTGNRPLSKDIALRVAKVLCPPGRDLDDFAREMLGVAKVPVDGDLPYSSRAERVKRAGFLTVGVVINEPFALSLNEGFAVELFEKIAWLLGVEVRPVPTTLRLMKDHLTGKDTEPVDVIVAGVLPTFHRESFMSFSRPFPYLRVSLSAIVREERKDLTAAEVLNWVKRSEGIPPGIRVLLIQDEVGHEFARSFLPGLDLSSSNQVIFETSLKRDRLYEKLANNEADLLLADIGTCEAVYAYDKGKKIFKPLRDPDSGDPVSVALKPRKALYHLSDFPILATYPVAFGLPKDDIDWRRTINRAMDSLMSEGIRSLLTLYEKYYLGSEPFRGFRLEDDEDVPSLDARERFRTLFEECDKKLSHATEPRRDLPNE